MPPPLVEVWRRLAQVDEGRPDAPVVPAAVGTDFVVLGYRGRVEVREATDGRLRSEHFLAASLTTAPEVRGGEIVVATQRELLWLAAAGQSGVVRRVPVTSPPRALAMTADGIVGADGESVWALAAGEPAWRLELPTVTALVPSPDGSTVYASTSSGRLLALDASTGAERWTYTTGDDVSTTADERRTAGDVASTAGDEASPAAGATGTPVTDPVALTAAAVAADGERLYVGGTDKRLVALDARDGDREWHRDLGTDVVAAPAVAGKRVWVTAHDARLYGFARNGTLEFTVPLPSRVYVDLVAHGPWVIAGPLRAARNPSWIAVRAPEGRNARSFRIDVAPGGHLRLSPASGPAGVALINGDGTVIFVAPQQPRR